MGQITEQFDEKIIQQMKTYYEPKLETSPPGAIFRARTDDAVITAYRSGKVLFQGANPERELGNWHGEKRQEQTSLFTRPSLSRFEPPAHLFQSNHIGSDESGTGDYFGPITACAVYVQKDQIETLKTMGIQDSKALNDQSSLQLAMELAQMNIPYSLMVISNDKYNNLQASGWTQGKMKTMVHYAVIEKLRQKIGNTPYEGILVDQFCHPPVYVNHLKSEGKNLPEKSYFMTKAESYSIAVAAGSVIARASFLKEMDKLSEQIGFPLLKGASQKVDQLIAKIIKEKGKDVLTSIAKVHFANTKKAEKYL